MNPALLSVRMVQTEYFDGIIRVKVTCSVHADAAIVHAIKHMQGNDYIATSCEVTDLITGELYGVVKWRQRGIEIMYQTLTCPVKLGRTG